MYWILATARYSRYECIRWVVFGDGLTQFIYQWFSPVMSNQLEYREFGRQTNHIEFIWNIAATWIGMPFHLKTNQTRTHCTKHIDNLIKSAFEQNHAKNAYSITRTLRQSMENCMNFNIEKIYWIFLLCVWTTERWTTIRFHNSESNFRDLCVRNPKSQPLSNNFTALLSYIPEYAGQHKPDACMH